MKWLSALVLLLSVFDSFADWELTGSGELGKLPGGASMRRAELSNKGVSAQLTAIVFPAKAY